MRACVCGHAPGPGVIVLAWGLKKKQRGESTHLANVVKHIKNYKKRFTLSLIGSHGYGRCKDFSFAIVWPCRTTLPFIQMFHKLAIHLSPPPDPANPQVMPLNFSQPPCCNKF